MGYRYTNKQIQVLNITFYRTGGATDSCPVKMSFGLVGLDVAPVGAVTENPGHDHLMIDAKLPDMSLSIPVTAEYKH